jgi:hypothetical protein
LMCYSVKRLVRCAEAVVGRWQRPSGNLLVDRNALLNTNDLMERRGRRGREGRRGKEDQLT